VQASVRENVCTVQQLKKRQKSRFFGAATRKYHCHCYASKNNFYLLSVHRQFSDEDAIIIYHSLSELGSAAVPRLFFCMSSKHVLYIRRLVFTYSLTQSQHVILWHILHLIPSTSLYSQHCSESIHNVKPWWSFSSGGGEWLNLYLPPGPPM